MKRIRIIILCCIVFIISCRKIEVILPPVETKDIFSKSEIEVIDGQDIQFTLQNSGKYTFILYDSVTQNVVSKEKFMGIAGNNVKKIYTKTLSQKTLYLYLSDENNNKIKQTKIIIN